MRRTDAERVLQWNVPLAWHSSGGSSHRARSVTLYQREDTPLDPRKFLEAERAYRLTPDMRPTRRFVLDGRGHPLPTPKGNRLVHAETLIGEPSERIKGAFWAWRVW